MATCKEAHALTPVCFQIGVFLCNNRSTEQVTQPHAEVNISHQHLETVYLPFLKLCSECVVQLCVLFIYLFVFMLTRKGEKKEKNAWCRKPSLLSLLPGGELGALREELGLGASLELQASVWLKAPSSCRRLWILLYSWRRFWKICSAGGKQETRKTGLKTYSHMLPTLRHLIVEMMVSVNYLEVFDANFKCPHLNSRISQLLFFAHRFVPGKTPAYFH